MYKFLLLNIFLTLFFGCNSSAQQDGGNSIIQRLDVAEFESKMSEENVVILDVRTPEEIQEGKIEGAIEIDFKQADFENKIDQLDKTKTYLVYCRSGNRSHKACMKMETKGFEKLFELKSGYNGWKKQHSKSQKR